MKKISRMVIAGLLLAGAAGFLSGCGGGDDSSPGGVSLTGTSWNMVRSDGVPGVFIFSTATNVALTCAMGTGYGTYTLNGSSVAFSIIMLEQVRFDIQGNVSGDNMSGDCTVAALDGSDVSTHTFTGSKI